MRSDMDRKRDPYRPADRQTRCPACLGWLLWNREDGLTGQTCLCGHIFTGRERPSQPGPGERESA
jgi:hypothetical protein